ncbi:transglutaminase domain-containing protein [Chitinophaga sancti]|nr:transglutaminase domain-containing protein [Chitinophaga sancti]WQD62575.1 transglutaminase domain-containing protein [Chitinophaga sancti]WQG91856.1 transglutaminase domain-containing protein [Chitinophaga sancti]
MRHAIILMLLLAVLGTQAQKASPAVNEFATIDKKALLIPDSMTKTTDGIARYMTSTFPAEKDRVRGIFIWVATNIAYDLPNMFAINFYESSADKINKPLLTRKGICENYANLFNDICLKAGIKSYVVEGFTKQNGFTDYIPHAWCATRVDSTWYMFDPTWGSGYVNGGKFYKKINNFYFKTIPANLIKSHMPFDFMWQFLEYPVSSQEFYDGKVQVNKSKPYFSYKDSIIAYERLSKTDQLMAAARRIEVNGVKNSMSFDRLQHIKVDLENDRREKENERLNKMVNLYNSAANDYNIGVNDLNAYINYRNQQFTPMKTDPEIQAMLDGVETRFNKAKEKISQIQNPNPDMTASIGQLQKGVNEVMPRLKQEQEWLTTYFGKSKSKRKGMFYEKKWTWFGIPLN